MKKTSKIVLTVALLCAAFALFTKAKLNKEPPQTTNIAAEGVTPSKEQVSMSPVPLTLPGLNNAYKISSNFYRGAQPTDEGYKSLADIGIKTIISFRTKEPNKELLKKLGIKSYHIPINTFKFNDNHAREFLKILSKEKGPIYIHCYHGSDRTGTMVALYRMVYDKWTPKQALAEMQDKKFGFHKMFPNLIEYINKVKLENIVPKETGENVPVANPEKPTISKK